MRRPNTTSDTWLARSSNHYNVNDFFRPATEGFYGMPILPRCDLVPANLYPYDKRKHFQPDGTTQAYHFFMDDAFFEQLWLRPLATLPPLLKAGATITPDFSLYTDWEMAIQIMQTYKTRWLGALWVSQGLQVIPSVSWSTRSSFEFAFDGLPSGGTFAIATMELAEPEAKQPFQEGLEAFLSRCSPDNLLVYGKGLKAIIEPTCAKYGCQVIRFASRFDELRAKGKIGNPPKAT